MEHERNFLLCTKFFASNLKDSPVLMLAIYYQTHKLEAWLKINHVSDNQRPLNGQSVIYQIPFLELHYFSMVSASKPC